MADWLVPQDRRLRIDAQPAGLSVRATAIALAVTAVIQRNGARVVRLIDEMTMADAIEVLQIWVADTQADAMTAADIIDVLATMTQADSMTMSDSFTVLSILQLDYYARPGELRPGASRLGTAKNVTTGSFLNIDIADVLGMGDAIELTGMSFALDDSMVMGDDVSALGTIPTIEDGMTGADEAVSSSEDVGPQTDDIITMADAVSMLALQDVADGLAAVDAVAQDGAAGIDDAMAAADAVAADGAASVADGITAADATASDGALTVADTITGADAQAALGTIATVADGITATDSATNTTPSGDGFDYSKLVIHLKADNVGSSTIIDEVNGTTAWTFAGTASQSGTSPIAGAGSFNISNNDDTKFIRSTNAAVRAALAFNSTEDWVVRVKYRAFNWANYYGAVMGSGPGNPVFTFIDNGGQFGIANRSWAIPGGAQATGTDHEIEINRTGGRVYALHDGTLLNPGGDAHNEAYSTQTEWFICHQPHAPEFFDGWIDDVQVFKGAGGHTANYTPAISTPFPGA